MAAEICPLDRSAGVGDVPVITGDSAEKSAMTAAEKSTATTAAPTKSDGAAAESSQGVGEPRATPKPHAAAQHVAAPTKSGASPEP